MFCYLRASSSPQCLRLKTEWLLCIFSLAYTISTVLNLLHDDVTKSSDMWFRICPSSVSVHCCVWPPLRPTVREIYTNRHWPSDCSPSSLSRQSNVWVMVSLFTNAFCNTWEARLTEINHLLSSMHHARTPTEPQLYIIKAIQRHLVHMYIHRYRTDHRLLHGSVTP